MTECHVAKSSGRAGRWKVSLLQTFGHVMGNFKMLRICLPIYEQRPIDIALCRPLVPSERSEDHYAGVRR